MAKRTTIKRGKRVDRKGALGVFLMTSYDKEARDATKETSKRVDRQGAMGSMIMLSYGPNKGRK